METKSWYVFYTYPQAEKKAYQWLIERGFEVFLPMNETIHYWKNRQKKIISAPMFPGYIFVRIDLNRIYLILQNPKIVKCITFNSTPSSLTDKDLFLIRRILQSGSNLHIEKGNLIGSKARIVSGPFTGYEGTLVNSGLNKKVNILLNSIPYCISVYVKGNCIEVVN